MWTSDVQNDLEKLEKGEEQILIQNLEWTRLTGPALNSDGSSTPTWASDWSESYSEPEECGFTYVGKVQRQSDRCASACHEVNTWMFKPESHVQVFSRQLLIQGELEALLSNEAAPGLLAASTRTAKSINMDIFISSMYFSLCTWV